MTALFTRHSICETCQYLINPETIRLPSRQTRLTDPKELQIRCLFSHTPNLPKADSAVRPPEQGNKENQGLRNKNKSCISSPLKMIQKS